MFQQSLLVTAAFAATALAQVPGEYTPEVHPSLLSQECTRWGCRTVNTSIVLDSNYRWLHNVGGYDPCKPSGFDPAFCPNATACGQNCALEGVDYPGTGIFTSGSSITLNMFKDNGTANSSPRVYMLEDEDHYMKYMLLNQEFTYDVDMSKVNCGVNSALYFSEMSATGDASDINTAGAKYGTGYCDAQCPKNSFVKGKANLDGTVGACCNEMDIWEANNAANALTPHPCNAVEVKECTGDACGNDLTVGTCDQGGCDYNPYRMGNHNFYGPGKVVDTTKPFTVITQFLTDNGRANGNLVAINRFYKQHGRVIPNSNVNIPGMSPWFNSITDAYCTAENNAFNAGNPYPFANRGGLKQMGKAFARGMVLVFSIWDDGGAHMQWLDGVTGDVTLPGNLRGPCSPTGGDPTEIQASYPDSSVTWSNVKIGDLGSTF